MNDKKKLIDELRNSTRYIQKIQILLKLFPEEIIGLNNQILEDVDFGEKPKLDNEIKIKKTVLSWLAETCQKKRSSMERGMSMFFTRKLDCINKRFYSQDWLVFGPKKQAEKQKPEKEPDATKEEVKPAEKQVPLDIGAAWSSGIDRAKQLMNSFFSEWNNDMRGGRQETEESSDGGSQSSQRDNSELGSLTSLDEADFFSTDEDERESRKNSPEDVEWNLDMFHRLFE